MLGEFKFYKAAVSAGQQKLLDSLVSSVDGLVFSAINVEKIKLHVGLSAVIEMSCLSASSSDSEVSTAFLQP